MHVVAIYGLSGDVAENARVLAGTLGVTPYEARARVQIQGGGPAVVGTRPDASGAEALADQLRSAGFSVLVCDTGVADEVIAFEARSFELGHHALVAATSDGERREIPWTCIDLLVRGVSSTRETTRKKVKQRQLSLGRAVVTGGLMLHKTKETEQVSTATTFEGFVVGYSTVYGPVALRELGVAYQSLGAAMQPSRTANFLHLVGELRRLAVQATFDDRLMRRAVQQQILGPTLDAEDHLDLAVALMARAHRGKPGSS
jgi:hypothetical protein